jgi:hypothetical protein
METHKSPDSPRQTASQRARRIGRIVAAAMVVTAIVFILWMTGLGRYLAGQAEYVARTPTFSGKSDQLKQTVIVPTLDTPCPAGKNVIWCSSFQLAWNELRDNVIHAPCR